MVTPTEWKNNLKNNIVTLEMFDAALFSVNKRAKNCRDQKRNYKFDRYGNGIKYAEKESEYYAQKEKLLSYIKPNCIHIEHLGFEKAERVFDYEANFDDKLVSAFVRGEICWSNCFVDRNKYYDYDYYYDAPQTYFFDKSDFSREKIQYYLFYDLGEHSYHTPIKFEDVKKYDLYVIDIDRLQTHGKEIDELCSTSFVKKILEVLESGNAVLEGFNEIPVKKTVVSPETNISKQKAENRSFAYNYWGEYIDEIINNELKNNVFVDISAFTDKQKELALEIEKQYKDDIENLISKLKVEFSNKLVKLEKEVQQLTSLPKNQRQSKNLKKVLKTPERI